MKDLDKKLELIFTILAVVGSFMVANKNGWGFIPFAGSSIVSAWWSVRKGFKFNTGLQCYFLLINLLGIYNYLIA